MKKNILVFVVTMLVVTLTGCGAQKTAEPMDPTITVETATIETGILEAKNTYIGKISTDGTSNVVARVSGTVENVRVTVGDQVSAGDLLCQFEDDTAQLNLENAKVSHSNAQAGYANAQAGVSKAQAGLSSAKAGYSSAQAGYSNAQSGYDNAQAQLNSRQEGYSSVAAGYGSSEDGHLTLLEEQLKTAEKNYQNAQTLYDAGVIAKKELDQTYNAMLSAQAALASGKSNLNSVQSGVESAQAGIGSAEATIEAARAGIESANAGVESAQANIQSAQAGIESAKASMEAAQVAVKTAEYQLSLYNVTAPISGVVEAVSVTANNFAASGNVIFVISNKQNKTATFYVTEEVRDNLQLGQGVAANQTYTGHVSEISGIVDASTGLFKVKALIDDAQEIPDGTSVEITTTTHRVENIQLIPSDAIYYDNGVPYVYLSKEGKAVKTMVTVALNTQESVAISSGVNPGETLITSWASSLKDGVPIHTTENTTTLMDQE